MLVNCNMTCETIDIIGIIYFTLKTGNSSHLVIDSSYGILGRTFGAVLHRM